VYVSSSVQYTLFTEWCSKCGIMIMTGEGSAQL
jgi:hypothetical protein